MGAQAYTLSVKRAALFALAVVICLSGSLWAQRGRGTSGSGKHLGFRGSGGFGTRGFARSGGAGAYLSPYGGFGYESSEGDVQQAGAPVFILRAPDRPISNGLVTMVPEVVNSTAPKVLPPPAIFILSSGERIESRKFVLTASELSVSLERQQRKVPLGLLDIQATVAANHERGVELRIPDDRSEISLGF